MNVIDFSPAKWIWTEDNLTINQKIIIQKRFYISELPNSAIAYVACDTKIWLWVNGRMAIFEGGVFRESRNGCGYAEKTDLAKYLQCGENTITALVWFYGNGGRNNSNSGEAGFIFKCEELKLYSCSDFLVARHPAFIETKPPKPSYLFGGDNIGFDANLDIGDFFACDFSSSILVAATEYPNRVWGDMIESPLPLLKVFPRKEASFIKTNFGAVSVLPYAMTLTVAFELIAEGNETVDVRTDRYAVNGGPGDECNVYNGHRIEYICKKGRNVFEGLMYLYGEKLIFSFPETVQLQKVFITESGYDTHREGSIETDHDLFNRLIEKSIRTLYVCMRNNFMDCPDRERGQWIGDVSVQAPQVFFVFDKNAQKLLKKAICDFICLRKGDVLVGNVPGENYSELPGQSLLALSEFGLIGEYYRYSGDEEIPSLVLDAAVNYLKLWEIGEDKLVVPREGNWRWFDHLYNVDDTVLENCLYLSAAKQTLKFAEICKKDVYAIFLKERIGVLSESIERHFWKGEYYASRDFVDERANAIAVLSGICQSERYPAIRKVLLSVSNCTPYFERFVLTALCEMGYIEDAYKRMMSRYYNLAVNDNSTLWEDFYILGTKNHAWSGCPLEIAFKYFLGLKTEDGFKTYTVSPVKNIFKHITYSLRGEKKTRVVIDGEVNG